MSIMSSKQKSKYKIKTSIIIPIGVIEQHGYHLPLNTDAVVAERLSRLIGQRTEILVAPTMYESFSGGELPGTVNISPAVMSLVVSDRLTSLAKQGFRNFYLFLCHGGSENERALREAIKMLLRNSPVFETAMIALMGAWEFDPKKTGFNKGFSENDWHAGWAETSIMMALAPELVWMDELQLDIEPVAETMRQHPDNYQQAEKIVDDKLIIPRMSQKEEVKVGVMGYPERANVETGRKMVEDMVSAAVAKISELESKSDGVYKKIEFVPEPLIFDNV